MAHDSKPGYAAGLITGAIFGALGALLLAPKKGDELRGDLKSEAEELKHKGSDLVNQAKTVAQTKLESVKGKTAETVEGVADAVTEKVTEVAESVAEKVESVGDKVEAVAESAKTKADEAKLQAHLAKMEAEEKLEELDKS